MTTRPGRGSGLVHIRVCVCVLGMKVLSYIYMSSLFMFEVATVDLGGSCWEGVPISNPPTSTRQAIVFLSQFGFCSIIDARVSTHVSALNSRPGHLLMLNTTVYGTQ